MTKKGITLIALVVTIVVILILAGVSLNMTLRDNGILTQAQNAVRKNEVGAFLEEANMAYAELYSDEASRTLGSSAEIILSDVVAK